MKIAVALLLLATAPARADPAAVTGQLEAGTELDTNAHRVTNEGTAAVAAPDVRAALRLGLSWRPSERASLRGAAVVAGKLFVTPASQDETVVVAGGNLAAAVSLGALAPGLRASYDEAAQSSSDLPDTSALAFRAGDAAATLSLLASPSDRLTASAGWRFFHYKPDPQYDFAGEAFGLSFRHTATLGDEAAPRELVFGLGYAAARRGYDSDALTNICADGMPIAGGCLISAGRNRDDLFHDLSFDLSYTSASIWGARYELQVLDSNSFGQSLARHRLQLSVTTELVADWFLHLKVGLVLEQHLDPLLLAGDLGTYSTIEEETRNTVVVHFTHDVGDSVTFEARWALYTAAFLSHSLSYLRQTFYVGLVVRL